MVKAIPPPLLASLLVGGAWITMKAWLGLAVAVGVLRLPERRSAFIRWLEEEWIPEEAGSGRRIDLAIIDCLALALCNVCPFVIVFLAPLDEPVDVLLTVAYFGFELCWLVWLARYVSRHTSATRRTE